MTEGRVWEPGEKTHRDENFPVASHLVSKRHRPPILAFYRFVRAADDVAGDPALTEAEKIQMLDRFENALLGRHDEIPEALPLRAEIRERGLTSKHAQDLLACIHGPAAKTEDLLGSASLSRGIKDLRLSMEVAAIERLARKLVRMLRQRDPLSQRVHRGKTAFASVLIAAVCLGLARRIFASSPHRTALLENR
jgi:hypothetical protein